MKMMTPNALAVSILLVVAGCSPQHLPATAQRNTLLPPAAKVAKPAACSTTLSQLDGGDTDYLPSSYEAITDANSETPTESTKKILAILENALGLCQSSQAALQKGDDEKALSLLDQAYALITTVGIGENPELIRQKEDLRFTISKRILDIYTARGHVTKGISNEIPLTLNEYVEKEIASFQGPERDHFLEGYQRSGKYRNQVVKALKEKGLPEELSWLPFIESWYKVRALSPARALGIWQFIPSTGYKYGLMRDAYVDERMDPEKATAAAIAYLKDLHQMFGDWDTVLAAYNCGEGRVIREIRKQNNPYLDSFWDLYQNLPRETARYVPRFHATLLILKDPAKYGFNLPSPDAPIPFETARVSRQVSLCNLAMNLDLTEETLKDLNPEIRNGLIPPTTYDLKVPRGKGPTLMAAIDSIPTSAIPQATYEADTKSESQPTKTHRVTRGDTPATIAAKYNTSTEKLMRANDLRKNQHLVAGQTLTIPGRQSVAEKSTPVAALRPDKKYPDSKTTHTVGQGDTLYSIAKRYNIDLKTIQALNNLSGTALKTGQVLTLSKSGTKASLKPVSSSEQSTKTYVVKKGDYPAKIAKTSNTPLARLLELNKLSESAPLRPGQTLYLD